MEKGVHVSGGGASQAASAGWGTGAALGAAVEAGQPPVDQRYSAKKWRTFCHLSCVFFVKEKGDGAVRVVFRMGTGVGEVT